MLKFTFVAIAYIKLQGKYMIDRESWREWLLGKAAYNATRSKDPRTKVGCVIVGANRETLSEGYNGLPCGVSDDYHPERMLPPDKYLWTSHAEENAVAFAARNGVSLRGATAYVTHSCCARCARILIQAGVAKVVQGNGITNMPQEEFTVARIMFQEAGVLTN